MTTFRQKENRRKTISKKIKEYLALGGEFYRVLHAPLHESKESRAEILDYVLYCILDLDFVPAGSTHEGDHGYHKFEDFRDFILERIDNL